MYNNKFVVVVNHNRVLKKFICKGRGYKLKNKNDRINSILRLNTLLNLTGGLINVSSFGTDENGLLLVEMTRNKLDKSINNIMLMEQYIEREINYNFII